VPDLGFDLWLVARLARESLDAGTLRGYWPGLKANGSTDRTLTVWVARLVYVALVPIVPMVAVRHRRLVAAALEGVVRAIVSGVEVPAALEHGVGWLERKGLDPQRARSDLERLLAGFLSASSAEKPEASRPRRDGSDLKSAG
jgi:hypothetical protein